MGTAFGGPVSEGRASRNRFGRRALLQSFLSACTNKVPATGRLAQWNCAPMQRLVLVPVIALFETGQLEMDGSASTGALQMKTFFKVVAWIAAAFVGLFLWNVTPDFRPIITWLLAAAFICYVLSTIVEVTVKRLIWDELLELRSRLEVLDRKVSAILRDALEQRRLR